MFSTIQSEIQARKVYTNESLEQGVIDVGIYVPVNFLGLP